MSTENDRKYGRRGPPPSEDEDRLEVVIRREMGELTDTMQLLVESTARAHNDQRIHFTALLRFIRDMAHSMKGMQTIMADQKALLDQLTQGETDADTKLTTLAQLLDEFLTHLKEVEAELAAENDNNDDVDLTDAVAKIGGVNDKLTKVLEALETPPPAVPGDGTTSGTDTGAPHDGTVPPGDTSENPGGNPPPSEAGDSSVPGVTDPIPNDPASGDITPTD